MHNPAEKPLGRKTFLLLPVMPDVLHIVIIFHGVDELLHHNGLLLVQGLVVLGDHLDLGGDEGVLAQVADDFEADGDVFTIYTLPDDFNEVVANLSKYTFVSAQIEMVPQNYQKLESEEHVKLMEKLIEIMEDDDDVQNIWHNWEE